MTSAHAFYIPMVVLAGLVLGFIWGRRSALTEMEARARREREREERIRERREARKGQG